MGVVLFKAGPQSLQALIAMGCNVFDRALQFLCNGFVPFLLETTEVEKPATTGAELIDEKGQFLQQFRLLKMGQLPSPILPVLLKPLQSWVA